MPTPPFRIVPVPGAPRVPAPSPGSSRASPPWTGAEAITGGGLVALVSPERGLLAAGAAPADPGDREDPALHPPPPGLDAPAAHEGAWHPPFPPHLIPGGWVRPLPGGGTERGILLDAFPLIVIQRERSSADALAWDAPARGTPPPATPDPGTPAPGTPATASPLPEAGGRTHLPRLDTRVLAPTALSDDAVLRVVRHLPGHALRRMARGEEDRGMGGGPGEGRGFVLDFSPGSPSAPTPAGQIEDAPSGARPSDSPVALALALLDQASLSDPAELEAPAVLLLAGMEGASPRFLHGNARAEVALGALAGGRWGLARALLGTLLQEAGVRAGTSGASAASAPEPDPAFDAALLLVASRWATWTGAVERLRPHAEALDRAARAFARHLQSRAHAADAIGVKGLPAAFPSGPELLASLADASEPLGDRGWTAELRDLGRELERTLTAHRAGGGGDDRTGRVRLPVLGQSPPGPDTPVGPRPREATLPPVQAFASPWHPALRTRRTLHAARLVRSAVEGLLGARPDANYGRIRLAPDLASLPPGPGGARVLMASGLRLADARVDLACRFDGATCSLRVSQVGGRVPVNVIFEPRLPMEAVRRVRFGDEEADVEIESLEGSVRLRFQFPLDPERSVTVD